MPEIIGHLNSANILNETQATENKGELIWQAIRARYNRAQNNYKPDSGDTFKRQCKRQLVLCLDRFPILRRELALDRGLEADSSGARVADKLWSETHGAAKSHSSLYRAAENILDAHPENRGHPWKAIMDVLGIVLLSMLDSEGRKDVLDPKYGFLDAGFLEVAESTPESVEICFSSAQPEAAIIPKLEFNQAGDLGVGEQRTYMEDRVERGLGGANSVLDNLLRHIWNLSYPREQIDANEIVDEARLDDLNRALKDDFEIGKAKYFLLPGNQPSSLLDEKGVIDGLKYRLPYLFVFRTGVEGRPRVISTDFSERNIKRLLQEFSKLFQDRVTT